MVDYTGVPWGESTAPEPTATEPATTQPMEPSAEPSTSIDYTGVPWGANTESAPDGIPEITITAPRLNAPEQVEGAPKESALDFLKTTVYNIPGSAANLVGGLVNVATHPIKTALTLGEVGAGELQKGFTAMGGQGQLVNTEKATQFNQMLADRYGSVENALHTIKTDPVGFAADISAGLTGVGGGISMAGDIAKLGKVAEFGQNVSKLGAAVDPLAAAGKVVKPSLGVLGAIPKQIATESLPVLSGVSKESLGTAFKAGVQGGDVNKIFNAAKKGELAPEQVINAVEGNVPAYKPTGTDATKIDVNPIRQDLETHFTQNFVPNADDYRAVVDDIEKANTPAQLDNIKRQINSAKQSLNPASVEARTFDTLITSIDKNIAKQAPGYVEHVKNTGKLNTALEEVKLNPTTENLDKLASTYKSLVPEIDIAGAMKAGRETSLLHTPETLGRLAINALSGVGGAMLGGSPMHGFGTAALTSAVQSPRLAGTVANIGGTVSRPAIKLSDYVANQARAVAESPAGQFAGQAGRIIQPAIPSALRAATGAAYLPQQYESNQDYIGRVAPKQ